MRPSGHRPIPVGNRPQPGVALAIVAALLAGLFLAVLNGGPAVAQDGPGEALNARVFSGQGADQVPYPGVTVTVIDEGGTEVASGQTDENGEVRIELPEDGSYTALLDVSTLPEGLVPRGDITERTVRARPGLSVTALFPLDELGEDGAVVGGPAGRNFQSRLRVVPQLALDGVKLGAIIAITAIGLSLIFGTTGLVNFAHGDLVTLGAVVAFFFNVSAGGPRMHLLLAAVFAIIAGALAGFGLERGIWSPLRKRGVGLISMLVISIGLAFIIRNVILIAFGGATRPYAQYNIQSRISLFGVAITPRDLTIIILSLTVLTGIGLMLTYTKIGKALRAVADNRDLAQSSGINVERVVLFVWMLGGALAGLGGVLLGATEQVNVNMGFNLLLLMFAGVILGGIGTAYGAMLGSLVVGIVSQVSTAFASAQLRLVWALLILIIVLLIRPQGLLGRAQRFG